MADTIDRLNVALASRYAVERVVGRGGMATVFLAEDLKHHRKVALKVLRPDLAALVGAERFLREIAVTANLQHPHILPLYDSGEADGLLFYVMPFVEGDTLRDRMEKGEPIDLQECVEITKQVASALDYAHERDVVHRDIKPANVLLQGGQAVVADFGVALALTSKDDPRLTTTGLATGTPQYMSPEQVAAEELDGRSDQYALACLVYEMLSGRAPFQARDTRGVILGHLAGDLTPLTEVVPSIGGEVAQVVARGLAKAPDDRFDTTRDFARALAAAAGGSHRAADRRSQSRSWIAGIAGALSIAALIAGWWLTQEPVPLDTSRVVVFPLVATGDAAEEGLGEDVATMIGHALDGVGSLRWIDGWSLLDEGSRADVRGLSHEDALRLGRDRRSGFIVTGRVVARGETTEVLLDLVDVAGDSVIARAGARGPSEEAWQTGLQAVNGLLPLLIESVPERFGQDLVDRPPVAVANFLLGERYFRRARGIEAIQAYSAAFAADSGFALAAMRGAQAATWEHDFAVAEDMVAAAMRLPLAERDRLFAQGLLARLRGAADTAVQYFEGAIAADSSFAEAWIQLGETFRHLAPKRPDAATIVSATLRRALAADSTATNVLFHLVEEQLRLGAPTATESLERFLAAGPQENLRYSLLLARDCVAGWDTLSFDDRVLRNLGHVNATVSFLTTGGAQLACPEALVRSALRADTASDDQDRFTSALTALHNILIAQGRHEEALMLLDSARVSTDAMRRVASGDLPYGGLSPVAWDREMRLRARSLTMLDEMIGVDVGGRTEAIAAEDAVEWGAGHERAYSDGLWRRAVWEVWRGRPEEAETLLEELRARAPSETDRVRAIIDVLPGHIALARGDSAEALRVFASARPRAPQGNVAWHFAYPLGLERLREAQLLMAGHRYHDAIEVASLLDASPMGYLIFLRPSLELRIEAAEALGEGRMAEGFRDRLAGMDARGSQ